MNKHQCHVDLNKTILTDNSSVDTMTLQELNFLPQKKDDHTNELFFSFLIHEFFTGIFLAILL